MAVGDTRTVTDRALIAAHERRLAGAVAGGCLAIVLVLAALFHGKRFGNPFDDKVQGAIVWHLSTRVLDGLLHLTDPVPMTLALAVLAAAAALCRRWALCAVTVLSPLLALLVTEVVLKPLVDRTHQGGLAFPSGHESAPACLATILSLVVLRSGWHVAAKAAAIAALVLYLALCAVALVGVFFHYFTDTIGAVCLSVACVLVTALVVDPQFT